MIVSICAPQAAAARAAQQRVGVVPTKGTDLMADEAAAVDEDLKNALVTMGGYDVVDAAAMRAQLASATEFGLDCSLRDVDCLSKLGVLANVDLIVWSRTKASKPGELEVELTVVDVKATKETGRDQVSVTATGGPARVASLKTVLAQILRGPLFGTLHVVTNVPGARITVGGNVPASMPMTRLDPGPYKIAAEAEGFQRVEREIVVKAGVVTRETLTLVAVGQTVVVKDPEPPVDPQDPPPPTVASGGPNLLVVGGFAGFGVGVAAAALCGALSMYQNAIVSDPVQDTDVRTDAQTAGRVLLVGAVGLGVLAVGAGGLGVAAMFLPE